MTKHHPLRVYIAGPYQAGDWGTNINRAVDAAERVHRAGHVPMIPHTHTALWSVLYPKGKGEWLEIDFAWLDACDALIRLDAPEPSPGAGREVSYANANGIDVYLGVEEFLSKHA